MVNFSYELEQINKKREFIESHFNYQDKITVQEIQNTGWYKQTDAPLTYNNGEFSSTSEGTVSYLSYQEENTNFSILPLESNLSIQFSKPYNVSFIGKATQNVSVTLFIIPYSMGEKLEVIQVKLNNKLEFSIPRETEYIRLAIRISGVGKFKLDSISVLGKEHWENIDSKSPFSRINPTEWFIPTDGKVVYNTILSSFNSKLEEKEFVYLPYRENNVKFTDGPQKPLKATPGFNSVNFEGEKDQDVDVKLFIILYEENRKKEIHQVDLNTKFGLNVSSNTEFMRLAIRISGKGKFSISNIFISDKGYWLTNYYPNHTKNPSVYNHTFLIDQDSLFEWGSKSNIYFHEEQKMFESKLIGKQYTYLPCVENNLIHDVPLKSVVKPKEKFTYDFYLDAEIYGDTNLSLFVEEYRHNKRINIYQVPFREKKTIKFHDELSSVKFLIKVQGIGLFRNINIGMDENPIEITNSVKVSMENDKWFNPSKLLQLITVNNELLIESNLPKDKKQYISFFEKNNNFNVAPEIELIKIRPNYIYEVTINSEVEEGVELLPMFVGYSGQKKTQVLGLKLNQTVVINPNNLINNLRLAFRVGGSGNCKIKSIIINESPCIELDASPKWSDSKEIDSLKIVPAKPLKNIKMAVIFDEFTTASYKEECELITFTPMNWLEILTNNKPDLLMVESAWQGNGGSWNRQVGYYGEENMKPINALLEWCKENNIPTVFWNKEDPIHFERFKDTAKRFDHIFTTDENMIPEYEKLAGHNNVYALPFAAQPSIHNPIKIVEERESKACFAGSYYIHHEDRTRDMNRVLDYAAKYGLDIYDRNYEKTKKGLMPNHRFPEKYQPFIKGNLKYYEIDKAYKGYKVMINVNTVKHSPTMFSRRVFEGLACGTPVVSTYAEGIQNIFGDLVYISENEQEIDNAFNVLLNDDSEYRKKSMVGIREVLTKHTYTHRLIDITSKIGLHAKKELPEVTILAVAHSLEDFSLIMDQFNRQIYKNKQLYVLIDTFEGYLNIYKKYNNKSVKVFVKSYMHNYQNIREWIDSPYLTFFSPNDYYGENYISDLMLSTSFTDSEFIGKSAYWSINDGNLKENNRSNEYQFVYSLFPSRTIVKKDVFEKEPLLQVLDNMVSNVDYGMYLKFGKKFYSNDKFNYVSNALSGSNRDVLLKVQKQIEV